jgi:hypothetical protein
LRPAFHHGLLGLLGYWHSREIGYADTLRTRIVVYPASVLNFHLRLV